MKRILSLLLAFVLLIGMIPLQASAIMYSQGFEYIAYEDHVKITRYCDNDQYVVIPSEIAGRPVTVIGDYTFQGCYNLYSVVIPDSVTHIETMAFGNCDNLTNIVIPDSVTYIGDLAFHYCSSLTNIVIPDSVTYIGDYAFSVCTSLTDIVIPDSVTHIGNGPFESCSSLTEILVDENNPNYTSDDRGVLFDKEKTRLIQAPAMITDFYEIPDSVTHIGDFAFECCYHMTGIAIPDGVTYIGQSAFRLCYPLCSIVLPDSVTYIGDYAFESCYQITDITIPDSVTYIGRGAFYGCNGLSSIVLPDNITSISSGTFYCCTNLTNIVIPDSVTSIDEYAFYGCDNLTNVIIPGSVTSIGDNAFYFCRKLTSITIPDSVTHIGNSPFVGCISLTEILVDENNPNYSSDDRGLLFDKEKTALIQAPGTIADSYVIPDSVLSINELAFYYCTHLTSIVIPESVASIDDTAFACCFNLNHIRFLGNPPSFGYYVFADIVATAYYPDENDAWTKEVMQDYGGHITWSIWGHTHEYVVSHIAPTCTDKGFTAYTCACGDSYAVDYVKPLGHNIVDSVCTRCGKSESDIQNPPRPADPSYGMFSPDDVLTRGMFFYALWNYFGSPDPESAESPFTDVSESDYYHDAILWAVENGISVGASETQFGSDITVLRAQAATWLWRAAGSPEPPDENPYTDVKEGAFYYDAALWATLEELCMGAMDATHFAPYEECLYGHINWLAVNHTHEYTATVTSPTCTRRGYTTHTCACGKSYVDDYVDAMGHDYGDITCTRCGSVNPDFVANNPFADVPAGAFYEIPVIWAVENGITNGTSEGSFSPDEQCLRAHVVTFLWRANGCPESDAAIPFADVVEGSYYAPAVQWAVENDITSGMSANIFGVNTTCNRAQIVSFLYRAK